VNVRIGTKHLVVLVGAFIAARIVALSTYPVYDDAYITYRYSQNLANGDGLVYNLDETVLGTTTPLFSILLAGLHAVGLSLPTIVPLLNVALDAALCVLVIRWVLRNEPIAALLFVAAYAVSPIAGRITAGGMEANAFVLMSLGSLVLYRRGRLVPAINLAGLSYFVRPEAIVMVAVLCLHRLIVARKTTSAFRLGAIALAIASGGMAIMYFVYGTILPQSVTAKSGLDMSSLTVLRQLVGPEPVSLLLLPVAIVGAPTGSRRSSTLRLTLWWGGTYLALYVVASPQIWSWYALPVQVTMMIFAGLGGAYLLQRLPRLNTVSTPVLSGAAAALMVLIPAAVLVIRGQERVTDNVYQEITAYCDNQAREGLTIYAGDIGIVGYACSPAKILDGAGLVWPERTDFDTAEDIIEAYRPDVLLLVATKSASGFALTEAMSELYQPTRRFNADGNETIPDPSDLPRGWFQDYILFERIDAG